MKLPFALAKRFVAGETFTQTVDKVRNLNNLGIAVSLDLLGENVTSRSIADQTRDEYIQLVRDITAQKLNASISIKLTMLGLDIDRGYTRDNLFALLDVAREHGVFVRIDMEGSAYTDVTVALFKEAFAVYGRSVGIVIQSYLYRTKQDIADLSDIGADVRICKGAYSEPEKLAIQKMPMIREAYKSYAAILLEKTPYPRIASHDDQIIEWVKKYTEEHGIDKSRFEFQMLYGLRQDTCEQLAAQGYNVRVYVPYGTMWFPYFSRRLKERKENIWFVVSTLFKK
jgi:proline dehydrogenase